MADNLLSPRSATASLDMSRISTMKYSEQAVWFLNGFWKDHQKDAEQVWLWSKKMEELDMESPQKLGKDGCELDQFWSARFLEVADTALTALARKEALKTIDQDANGKISMIEYLAWKYKKSPKAVADAPQGDNTEAVKRAQAKMEMVQTALEAVLSSLAKLKDEEAKLKVLEAELKAAVAALQAEEDAYHGKIKELDLIANHPTSPRGVAKSKASAELAQLKAEDPLPLRRAKITQEAALRKCEKQKKQVEAAIKDLESKQDDLQKQMNEAQAELKKAEAAGGGGKGAIWWMGRGMYEADAYLPKSKQRYDHSKPFQG